MTWWKTFAYWIVAAALAGVWVVTRPVSEKPEEPEAESAVLLSAYEDEITSLTLQRSEREVRCERGDDGRWRVVRPEGVTVPSDLVSALIDNLTDSQQAQLVRKKPSAEDLESFGFEPASTVIEVGVKGKDSPLRIEVGGNNPPRTAVYARSGASPEILLVGLNVEYYSELLFEAAYPGGTGESSSGSA